MSNLPTPIMRPSSFDHSMEEEQEDLHHDSFFTLSHEDDDAISRFLAEQTTVADDNEISHRCTVHESSNQDIIAEIARHPQRVTPFHTAPEKRRASDTTSSSSSTKPPDAKKTRGLECHVKNLSLIFEALSAS